MKINVIGASGQLGRKVILSLIDQGVNPEDIIASVRSPKKVAELKKKGVDVRHADYEDGTLLESAFQGTDTLLVIPTTAPVEPRIIQFHNALKAAQVSGVKRIVLSSICSSHPNSVSHIAPFYLYAESKLRLSGIEWTIVRNNLYIDPVAEWVPELIEMGKLPYPVNHGRVAYVSRNDLARATAAACMREDVSRTVFELSGERALTMQDLGEIISNATGKNVPFEEVSEEEYIRITLKGEEDLPKHMIDSLVSLYRAVDNGEFGSVTNHIEYLTGKEPETVESYMERYLSK